MAKKAPQRSTKKEMAPSDFSDVEMVEDVYTGQCNPYPLEYIKRISHEALEYIENTPRCLKISQYIRYKRLKEKTYYNWVNKYPWFEENHKACLRALGDKREVGMCFKELDRDAQLYVMYHYDPDWVGHQQRYNDLKKDVAAAGGIQVVEIPVQRSTGKIPLKKEKKEVNDRQS